jgi:hypothetical protein
MKIRAYILFPESEDAFIQIGDNADSYENLIKEILVVKNLLRSYRNFELCIDSANVDLFLNKAEQLVGGEYLANCRIQLERIFGNKVRNVNKAFLRKNDCIYVNWNINLEIEHSKVIIAEAAEAKINEGDDEIIFINIANAYLNNRDFLYIIKDAVQQNDLPSLISIRLANNEIEFSEWLSSLTNGGFSLRDKLRFEKTNHRWKKQWIFREISTGRYWYYDYFHKDNVQHFEVFDSDGRNLGVADLEGILDITKAKVERRIDDIIN